MFTPFRKQNVFVPKYPGKEVYEEYHSVPNEEYLPKAKEALEKFLNESNDSLCIRTLNGNNGKTKIASHLTVAISSNAISIESIDGFKVP